MYEASYLATDEKAENRFVYTFLISLSLMYFWKLKPKPYLVLFFFLQCDIDYIKEGKFDK